MRILPPMPLSEGYETPSISLNEEEGVLEIFHPSEGHLLKESQIIPEILILRCQIYPIMRPPSDINVQLISENEALESAPLYDENVVAYGYDREIRASQWQGMALEYTGIGTSISDGESLSFQDNDFSFGKIKVTSPLYLKPFRVEVESHKEHHLTLEDGAHLITPPAVLNKQVLHGYGGYYKEGISFEHIQQIYYSLTSTHNATRIRLISTEQLQEEGVPPPTGGESRIFSPSLREEEYLSLGGALTAGYALISLEIEEKTIPFKSFRCAPLNGHPTFINVYFKPN
ncbi:hypothetical protein QPK87_21175 [Kamptonema cortianum]|jgi:hypothetical protein|nr:hypothetical protein [Geitlerinema splendidum]MDK3159067.1 hypothetical protein [Kamptonema cortianum]